MIKLNVFRAQNGNFFGIVDSNSLTDLQRARLQVQKGQKIEVVGSYFSERVDDESMPQVDDAIASVNGLWLNLMDQIDPYDIQNQIKACDGYWAQ